MNSVVSKFGKRSWIKNIFDEALLIFIINDFDKYYSSSS